MVKFLKEEWGLGYDPVAVFDSGLQPAGMLPESVVHETMSHAEELARSGGMDTIFFAMPDTRRDKLAPLVRRASLSFRHVVIMPNLAGIVNSAVSARYLAAGTLALEIKHRSEERRVGKECRSRWSPYH